MASFLKEKYDKEVSSQLKEKLGGGNVMAVPRILKVTLNCGIGKFIKEKDAVEEIAAAIRDIAGQKPVFQNPRNRSPVSRSARVWKWASWSPCAGSVCGISLKD